MKLKSIFKKNGFSIMEVLVAIAIFSLFVPGIILLSLGSLSGLKNGENRTKAISLAQEGLEAVRAIRDHDWSSLSAGTYGVSDASGSWQWSGNSDTTGIFARQITVTNIDTNRNDIDAQVTWPPHGSITLSTRLTNWKRMNWKQTTANDFNAGTLNSVAVTNNNGGEVQLAEAQALGTWTSVAVDTGSASTIFRTLSFTKSGVGTVKFQMRTGITSGDLNTAIWVGPDGTNGSFYTVTDTPIVVDPNSSGTRWMQAKTTLSGDGVTTPILEDLTLIYDPY